MDAIYVLVGMSLLIAGGFLAAFIWTVRNGQYDDNVTPAIRMLFEDKHTDPSLTVPPVTSTSMISSNTNPVINPNSHE